MFGQVIACLDGSSLAEKILPLARGVTIAAGGRLTLLRVVEDAAELAAEEEYQRDCARQYGADVRFRISSDAADAIVAELERVPGAVAALTTHGRSAWLEALLGSVAFRVIRAAKR
jgi:nucleotide-binding universal stress UspA family protein